MLTPRFRHRQLLIELVKRELYGRYRGSLGGIFWSLAEPLFMLGIYVAAFGFVMQVRWSPTGGAKEYALMMFAGLMVFQAFSDCLNKAPRLIVANPNFVKKVVFPLEILPWVIGLSSLTHLLISVGLWLVAYAALFGIPHGTAFYVPLLVIVFLPTLLAVGWLLAAFGVIIRDTDQISALLSRALIFVTPIFYSLDAVPQSLRNALLANPLTFVVEQFRRVLFIGVAPDFVGLLVYFCVALLSSVGALLVFRRLRPIFADNL